MKKIQKHIEIVRTSTIELSSMSLVSCAAIYGVLAKNFETVGISTVNNLNDLELLALKQPDLVFMGAEFLVDSPSSGRFKDDKIWISSFLEEYGIAHTGSLTAAGKLERYKDLAKHRVTAAGLNTAHSIVARKNIPLNTEDYVRLTFPLFVKPASFGGGKGIDDGSVVESPYELHARVELLQSQYAADVLIEEYLPGREFSVAVLKDVDLDELLVMPIEIISEANEQGRRILGAAIKSQDEEETRAVTDIQLRSEVSTLARSVFIALGARDYGRIDIRLDKDGVPHFLEANLIPSLIRDYGNFPKACAINIGMGYEQMLLAIVQLGLSRTAIDIDFEIDLPIIAALSPA